MKQIRISDVTMKQAAEGFNLSFKEKIELSKLLDRLGVDLIELEGISNPRIDGLRIKSIAAAVGSSAIAVPVQLNSDVSAVWNALQTAKHPRLQVCAPVSPVQMEYLFHKKPEAMLSAIENTISACKAVCPDVEFIADDATRSEPAFLSKALQTAISAGATTVTLCDTAGTMLPTEFAAFIQAQYITVPALETVTLGISCVNTLSMADACAIAAISAGAGHIKAATYPLGSANLANIARLISAKGDALDAECGIHTTQLSRIVEQIAWMCQSGKGKPVSQSTTEDNSGIYLSEHDDIAAISRTVEKLGYDLSEEDIAKVYDAFRQIVQKKERVSTKELDAIIASAAMQVPATYQLDTYVVTSGNTISATAHIKLTKNGQAMEGVCMGDGSIDAAFMAIEKITGCHYELDDFQLQAVTEGREAMGQTVVKLRAGGKVYSGRGISTDIVGAGIRAYLSALNKIVYEEAAE
ncbi:MAG: hypothetical protein J6A88_04110 [Oscillospiraceae bacterium]|nr:hypothetical protein [Oscillospiraceae bacterium]